MGPVSKFLKLFFNNISFKSQKTEKVTEFSKFSIVLKLQPLQYGIFTPLQQHLSLPFAIESIDYRSTYIDVRSS